MNNNKRTNIHITKGPEGEENKTEKVFEEIMTELFPNLVKDINLQSQGQQIPNRVSPNKSMFRSIIISICCCVYNFSVTPSTTAPQTPLFIGFPRQEYWSGLSFPSLEDLPDPGIETVSSALAGRFFATEPPGRHKQPLIES